jgi:hypothetical protein
MCMIIITAVCSKIFVITTLESISCAKRIVGSVVVIVVMVV